MLSLLLFLINKIIYFHKKITVIKMLLAYSNYLYITFISIHYSFSFFSFFLVHKVILFCSYNFCHSFILFLALSMVYCNMGNFSARPSKLEIMNSLKKFTCDAGKSILSLSHRELTGIPKRFSLSPWIQNSSHNILIHHFEISYFLQLWPRSKD